MIHLTFVLRTLIKCFIIQESLHISYVMLSYYGLVIAISYVTIVSHVSCWL